MAGLDRATLRPLDGWDHVVQSILVIFTTSFGERVLRGWFGSSVPQLLGNSLTPATVVQFFSAIIACLEVREVDTGLSREPRFKIVRIAPDGSPEQMRLGTLRLAITGIYMPRGHLGDTTPQDIRTITLAQSATGGFETVD